MRWLEVLRETALFLAAGVCEIGGGWAVWKCLREGKAVWWSYIGNFLLVCYGVVPTLQRLDDFGRLYAVYGGYFIVLSLIWGWLMDGKRPDIGDVVGGFVALVGVLMMLYWPRGGAKDVTAGDPVAEQIPSCNSTA
eukprot:gnl/TRDRNA2_/TRDRNA2_207846_c0_seq1.p2 gnl/TRDRNA2_/TRDRNA2_207846_c0~~gnl/TRDRNA2_/TRDRNA2_207846_c0_seq1.p2  ORF type:complete len:136 (-),score=19.68 gnl/TRDRNA2_/TRDRNA2_207846_c0_seq1:251-658(-)